MGCHARQAKRERRVLEFVLLLAVCHAAAGRHCETNAERQTINPETRENHMKTKFAFVVTCLALVAASLLGASQAEAGACTQTRVDFKNSTDYPLTFEIVDWGIKGPLGPNKWVECPGPFTQTVTLKVTYKGYTTTQSFQQQNCNIRVRVVRLSPGIIRLERI